MLLNERGGGNHPKTATPTYLIIKEIVFHPRILFGLVSEKEVSNSVLNIVHMPGFLGQEVWAAGFQGVWFGVSTCVVLTPGRNQRLPVKRVRGSISYRIDDTLL